MIYGSIANCVKTIVQVLSAHTNSKWVWKFTWISIAKKVETGPKSKLANRAVAVGELRVQFGDLNA